MGKFLTITVTNYNDSATILRQLNSIVDQTVLPDELIISDDCSTDNSRDIIQKFYDDHKDKLDITTLFHDQNTGYNNTTNHAIGLSQCKYLFMASANDYLLPTFVENLYAAPEDSAIISCTSLFPQSKYYDGWMILKPHNRSYYIPGHSSCVRKDYLKEFGCHKLEFEWHCDWFFLHAIALKYGWYGVAPELTVKEPCDNSYANVGVTTDKQLTILSDMVHTVNKDPAFKDIKDGMLTLIKNLPRFQEVL